MANSGAEPFVGSSCERCNFQATSGPPSLPALNIENETAKRQFLEYLIVTMFRFGGRAAKDIKTPVQLVGCEDVYNRSSALLRFIAESPLFVVEHHPVHLHLARIQRTEKPTVLPAHEPNYEILRLPEQIFDVKDRVQSMLARVQEPGSKTFLGFHSMGWSVGGGARLAPFCDGVRVVQLYDPANDKTVVIILPANGAYDETSRANERAFMDASNLTALLQHERVIKFMHGADDDRLLRCYGVLVQGFVNLHWLVAAISTEFDPDLILGPNRNSVAVACKLPMPRYCSMSEVPGTLNGMDTSLSWEDMVDLPLNSEAMQQKAVFCSYGAEMCYRAAAHLASLRPSLAALENMLINVEDLPPVT